MEHVFVEETEEAAAAAAARHYGAVRAAYPRFRCARHLVLLCALAVFDARLAG